MRKIGARLLAFLAVAAASFALWSGLALAGSSVTTNTGTDATTEGVTRAQLIQTQETPDAQETPGRHTCPRRQNDDNDTDSTGTETSSAAV